MSDPQRLRLAPRDESPPPWTCRLRALVRLGTADRRLTALAVVAYAETPVGPYGEALLAEVRLPLRVTVPWIVVDSAASLAAGRRNWALPKTQAALSLDLDAPAGTVTVAGSPSDDLRVRARVLGPRLPVAGAALLQQPGRGPAPLLLTGRARAAVVRVDGGRSPGTGPGVLLDGVLRLGAPWPTRSG